MTVIATGGSEQGRELIQEQGHGMFLTIALRDIST